MMASKVTGHVVSDDGRTVTVTVAHLDTDSFTRSVDPAAMRWANRAPVFRDGRQWACVSGDYGRDVPAGGRACESRIRFEVR